MASNHRSAENDSVSYAYSVILAHYISPDFPADNDGKAEFLKGFKDSVNDSLSKQYLYGLITGKSVGDRIKQMSSLGVEMNREQVVQNIIDILKDNGKMSMSPEEANNIINAFIASTIEIIPDSFSISSQNEFMESFKTLENVETLPSGVLLIIEVNGTGQPPRVGEKVLVSYEGRLSDGSVFDVTESPIEMIVGGLVPGFNEGLLRMKVGGKYRLIIPADQAYGSRGVPGAIPGNAALDFTVKLEQIVN